VAHIFFNYLTCRISERKQRDNIMDIQGKKIMILGGWGLVGTAILRRLSLHQPKEVVLLSLKKEEAKTACENMLKETTGIDFIPEWGNIFVNHQLKDLPRAEMFSNPEYRTMHLKEVMETLDEKMLTSSWLYQLISKHKPDILIDAVNSATSLAYQDVLAAITICKGN
jgi:NAD dependent epimerase/dehydratase family enzyme